jgi:hypothetical protein
VSAPRFRPGRRGTSTRCGFRRPGPRQGVAFGHRRQRTLVTVQPRSGETMHPRSRDWTRCDLLGRQCDRSADALPPFGYGPPPARGCNFQAGNRSRAEADRGRSQSEDGVEWRARLDQRPAPGDDRPDHAGAERHARGNASLTAARPLLGPGLGRSDRGGLSAREALPCELVERAPARHSKVGKERPKALLAIAVMLG